MKKMLFELKFTKFLTCLCILLMAIFVLFTKYDAFLYHNQTIGIVLSQKQQNKIKLNDEFNNEDYMITQQLELKILNGNQKNKKIKVINTYYKSGALTQRYKIGQQLFLNKGSSNKISIVGQKRDTLVAFLAWITISLLLILMKIPGVLTLISLSINILLLFIYIKLDLKFVNIDILMLFGSAGILMTFVTLMLALGFNKKMIITFFATLISTFSAIIIAIVVMILTNERGLEFQLMDYVTQLPKPIFLAQSFLAALGAIMDATTDIVATQFEVRKSRPTISKMELFRVGNNIGKSIMGALISVLFLIFMVQTFAISILYLKNGNTWAYTIRFNMILGLTQTVIAGIGIVLSVPIASGLTAYFSEKKEDKRCQH